MKVFIFLGVIGLVIVPLVGSAVAQSTSPLAGCSDVNWPPLSPLDPAYASALDFTQELTQHHFIVTCVAPSKMTDMFEGQEGAAIYRTNEGDFEALFLPKPQNFDKLQIVEQRQRGRYLYSFGGLPGPRQANLKWNSDRPEYLIKHVNQLIVVRDKQLATRIESALAEPPVE